MKNDFDKKKGNARGNGRDFQKKKDEDYTALNKIRNDYLERDKRQTILYPDLKIWPSYPSKKEK